MSGEDCILKKRVGSRELTSSIIYEDAETTDVLLLIKYLKKRGHSFVFDNNTIL